MEKIQRSVFRQTMHSPKFHYFAQFFLTSIAVELEVAHSSSVLSINLFLIGCVQKLSRVLKCLGSC